MRFHRGLFRALLVAGLLVEPAIATGQPAEPAKDPAAAQALFDQGVALLRNEDWAAACPKFDASMRLEPSVGAQVNIARCHAHEGLVARAWGEFKRAKSMNSETFGEERKKRVDAYVDEQIAALEPRIPWMTVKVSPSPAGLDLSRDGVAIPADERVPVDPGKHVIEAKARGFRAARAEVELGEGENKVVTLTLVPGPSEEAEPAPSPKRGGPSAPGPRPDPALLIAGGVLGGVGVLGLGIAAITGGVAASDHATIGTLEDSGDCRTTDGVISCKSASQQQAHDAIARGEALALTSTITLFAGGALAAAGLTCILVGATRTSGGAERGARVYLAPTPGGLVMGGTF